MRDPEKIEKTVSGDPPDASQNLEHADSVTVRCSATRRYSHCHSVINLFTGPALRCRTQTRLKLKPMLAVGCLTLAGRPWLPNLKTYRSSMAPGRRDGLFCKKVRWSNQFRKP